MATSTIRRAKRAAFHSAPTNNHKLGRSRPDQIIEYVNKNGFKTSTRIKHITKGRLEILKNMSIREEQRANNTVLTATIDNPLTKDIKNKFYINNGMAEKHPSWIEN